MTSIGKVVISTVALIVLSGAHPARYPVDGYEQTGIRRLLMVQRIISGERSGTPPVPGARKSIQDIGLGLIPPSVHVDQLPTPDPEFNRAVNGIFTGLDPSYSVAVLDITRGKPFRYAERNGRMASQPGSVGKLAVIVGLMTELKTVYPDSFESRRALLRNKQVRAGSWAVPNTHTVPIYDPEEDTLVKRKVIENDVFSLYEWVDHMMSVSSNAAASIVWREAVLLRVFGSSYAGLTEQQAEEYFASTPRAELSRIANDVVNAPLRDLGISEDEWRLGSFFTRGASAVIPGIGGSTGTVRGLITFLLRVESGDVVDVASSLEIKRMMYMTDRRIRYAASPALTNAAVYFKSGSLYSCKEEEGFTCEKYHGNVRNFMNSVALVEHPDGTTYMVVLMSNVLKKNSASDHLTLASSIDRIVRTS